MLQLIVVFGPNLRANNPFHTAVDEFIRIVFRRIAWQIKQLNVLLMLFDPSLDFTSSMNGVVINNKEDFLGDSKI